jgi:high-affinity iron transporter
MAANSPPKCTPPARLSHPAQNHGFGMLAGGVIGLILGSLVCLITYLGLVTIPMRYLFGVTSTLIALLAAGMAAQAIAFLQQADILTAFDQTVWNTSWILRDDSWLGRALHTLIGYVDKPTAMQLIVYAATLIAIAVLMKLFSASPGPQRQQARAA